MTRRDSGAESKMSLGAVEVGDTSRLEGRESERCRRDVNARLTAMRAISKCLARQLRDGSSAVEHGELLYDEHGLPK